MEKRWKSSKSAIRIYSVIENQFHSMVECYRRDSRKNLLKVYGGTTGQRFICCLLYLNSHQGNAAGAKYTMVRLDRSGEFRTEFEKNRRIILRTQQICGICGNPVDFKEKYPSPLSPTVDHIIPIAKGGHPSDLANLQLAHRWCNRAKSDKLLVAMQRTTLESDKEVNNDDLPWHYDWKQFRAQ